MKTAILDHTKAMNKGHETAVYGREAVFTTYEGERVIGTVEAPTRWSSGYPIVTFADGTWARLDTLIEVVNV